MGEILLDPLESTPGEAGLMPAKKRLTLPPRLAKNKSFSLVRSARGRRVRREDKTGNKSHEPEFFY
jgi:hypothetical protein